MQTNFFKESRTQLGDAVISGPKGKATVAGDMTQEAARAQLHQIRANITATDGTIKSGYLSLHNQGKAGYTLETGITAYMMGDKAQAAEVVKALIKTAYGTRIDIKGNEHLENAIDSYLKAKDNKLGTVSFVKIIDTMEAVYAIDTSRPAPEGAHTAGPTGAAQKGSVQLSADKITHSSQAITKHEKALLESYVAAPGSYDIRDVRVSPAQTPDQESVRNQKVREFIASTLVPDTRSGDVGDRPKELEGFLRAPGNVDLIFEIRAMIDADPDALAKIVKANVNISVDAIKGWVLSVTTPNASGVAPLRNPAVQAACIEHLIDASTLDMQTYQPNFSGIASTLNTGNATQTAFLRDVIGNYFAMSNEQDQRAMLASVLRDTGLSATTDPQQKTRQEFVAFAKGSGPYLQKYLQEYSKNFNDPALTNMLQDAKRGLAPIPETIRNAYLAEMMQNSQPPKKITQIEVVKDLGAASIAQVFLMRLHTQDGQSEDVAVKLLRPGVAQRAAREKEIIMAVATSGAHGRTAIATEFEHHARAVVHEFDMTAEARNIASSAVFNGSVATVGSVIQSAAARTAQTEHALVMGLASGEDVAKFEAALALGAAGQQPPAGFSLNMGAKMARAYIDAGLENFKNGLLRGGFFHGDMHTGNVRYDPVTNQMILIDWGNAHTLEKKEQQAILKMYVGLICGDPEYFLKSLQGLMSEQGKQALEKSAPNAGWTLPTQGEYGFRGDGNYTMENYVDIMVTRETTARITGTLDERVGGTGEVLSRFRDLLSANNIPLPESFANFIKSQKMISDSVENMKSLHQAQHQAYAATQTAVAGLKESLFGEGPDAIVVLEKGKLARAPSPEGEMHKSSAYRKAVSLLTNEIRKLDPENDQAQIDELEAELASVKERARNYSLLLVATGRNPMDAAEVTDRMRAMGFSASEISNAGTIITQASAAVRVDPPGNIPNFYTPLLDAMLENNGAAVRGKLDTADAIAAVAKLTLLAASGVKRA